MGLIPQCRTLFTATVTLSVLCMTHAFFTPRPLSRIVLSMDLAKDSTEEMELEEWEKDPSIGASERKSQFKELVSEAMVIADPEHLPRLLANNIQVITSLRGEEGAEAVSELLEKAKEENKEHVDKTTQAVEAILGFAEDFVAEANALDTQNKELMGRILKTMASDQNSGRDKEDLLDELMEAEKEHFTAGFLRHLEGECERIARQKKMSNDSYRLLEIIRVIQARVLEEIGKEMGEATLVLGQLMGYDDENELIGVLDAGLSVRGEEFAREMSSLTKEALDGFQRVPGGVDPGLVERVTLIEKRLDEFLSGTAFFQ